MATKKITKAELEAQLENTRNRLEMLSGAVYNLYYSAYWYPDRCVDAGELWASVRDAAGFPVGATTEALGAPNGPVTEYWPCDGCAECITEQEPLVDEPTVVETNYGGVKGAAFNVLVAIALLMLTGYISYIILNFFK